MAEVSEVLFLTLFNGRGEILYHILFEASGEILAEGFVSPAHAESPELHQCHLDDWVNDGGIEQ